MVTGPMLGLTGLLATSSDSLYDSGSLETGTLVPSESMDTLQSGDVASLLLLIIFALGMIAGLIAGSIMWRRID